MKGSLRTVASGSTLAAVFAIGSDVYFFLATLAPTQSGASVTDFYTNTSTASLTYSSLNDLSGTDVAITAGNINRNSVILALGTGPTIPATIQGSPVTITTPVSGKGTWRKIMPQLGAPNGSIKGGSLLSLADYSAFVGVFAFTNTVALSVVNPAVYYFLSTLSATSGDFKSEAAGPFGSNAAEVDFASVDGLSGQQSLEGGSEISASKLMIRMSNGVRIAATIWPGLGVR